MNLTKAIKHSFVAAVSRSDLMCCLSKEELEELAKSAQPKILKKGQALFHHRDAGDGLYAVSVGVLEASILSAQGKKMSLNMMKAGDVVGEISALDHQPRTATVIAQTDCLLFRIGGAAIHDLIATNPRFAQELVKVLCARLRWINQQVEDMALLNTESRLASRLLLLYDKFSDDTGTLKISQSDLSEFLGSSRQTVNKTLQAWRSEGVVDLGRGTLKVLDVDELRNLALPPTDD